jgi:ATP-dependent helicase/nuclease subunit A
MTTRSVIIASAGSGKTFTLANRLIGWMVHRLRTEGDPGCDRILASTFTRKAAGEILQRVLEHLAKGVLDPNSLDLYKESFGLDVAPDADELRSVLISFVRLLHRVQISTLDGVFHRICQCFSAEIGLPANWSIADSAELERLRAECVNEVLESVDRPSMTLLLKLMHRGRRKRSVHADITRKIWGGGFGTELLQFIRATRMAPDPLAPWAWLAPAADGSTLDGGCVIDSGVFASAVGGLERAPLHMTQSGAEDKRWVQARAVMVDDVRNHRWEDFLCRTLTSICSIREGQAFHKGFAPQQLVEATKPFVHHAIACCIKQRHEELIATRSVLTAIETVGRQRQERAGLYTFSDIEQLLAEAGVVQRESLSILWFRLDGMVRDLAFDEFQDTSTKQFMVLDPLIEEVLSGEGGDADRGFLVLADPKQSIYGWRGGTPGLIDDVESMYADRLDSEPPLIQSWRSSSIVLEFVNKIFGTIEENAAISTKAHAIAGAQAWAQRYQSHVAARDLPGHVQIRVPAVEGEAPSLDHALQMAVDLIVERHGASPTHTIGVLVSKNTTATRLVASLRKAGVDASEEGSSLLVDSPAVLAMISLFHLAQHPGDTRSLYHIATSPLGTVLDVQCPDMQDRQSRQACARDLSRRIRTDLLAMGYASFIRTLTKKLEGVCTPRDSRRLRQLVESAEIWDTRATLEPGDFVKYIEGTPRTSAATSSIRVMTVHKSKGLEFDEVVLPELTRDFSRFNDSIFLHRPHPTSPPSRIVPVLNEKLAGYFPSISELYLAPRMHDAVQDALSVLYVAMTRARHGLHLILLPLDQDKKNVKFPTTAAGIIRAALPELEEALQSHAERVNPVVWSRGQANWSSGSAPSRAPDRLTLHAPRLSPSTRIHRPRVTPSTRGERSMSELLGVGRFASMGGADRGTLLHELFRHVGWIEDGTPGEAEMAAALSATARMTGSPVSKDRRDEAIHAFQLALSHQPVNARLMREAYVEQPHDELVLWRERPMHVPLDDRIIVGRFDRVVIGRQNGAAVWADVIDYKSDWVGDDGGVALLERYTPQLQTYVDAVQAMLNLPVGSVTARLLCTGPGIDLQLT